MSPSLYVRSMKLVRRIPSRIKRETVAMNRIQTLFKLPALEDKVTVLMSEHDISWGSATTYVLAEVN